MFEKMAEVEHRFHTVEALLQSPDLFADPKKAAELMREQKELLPVMEAWRAYTAAKNDLEAARELASDPDPEMRELGQSELDGLLNAIPELEQNLRLALLPKDRDDDKSVILELRAGVGGEEAALFTAELLDMYQSWAGACGFSWSLLSVSETELGGVKEASAAVEGAGAFARFKFESGTHRVQRVPRTDSQGKIQTSAATVAVLPEAEEVDVVIDPADLQIDTYRSSGAGGQHVNKTESAIRITHIPTGTVVECQDQRSQHKNRDRAMQLLRSRLYDAQRQAADAQRADQRRSQVGSGDRSQRIRTYNYPQGRVTDHRINLTLYKLEAVLAGDLSELTEALTAALRAEQLKGQE